MTGDAAASPLNIELEEGTLIPAEQVKPRSRGQTCCIICCSCFLVPIVAFILFVLIYPLSLTEVRADWNEYLDTTPPIVEETVMAVLKRAQSLVLNATNITKATMPYNLDVVISGGGSLSYYWLGISTVLKVYESMNYTKLHRFAGASAGAQEPFKAVAMQRGESVRVGKNLFSVPKIINISPDSSQHKHLETALAYALVVENHKHKFSNDLYAAVAADVVWKDLGRFLESQYLHNQTVLDDLTDKVFVQVTLLNLWSGKLLSTYTDANQARQAFIATGSAFVQYEGSLAVDGGGTDCAPHFKDGKRTQLVVTLTDSGLPMRMVTRIYGLNDVVAAVHKGQDDIIAWLQGGEVPALEFKDEVTSWPHFSCL